MTSGNTMKILELINKGAEVLSQNLSDINYRFESELLLSFVLKKERVWLLLHQNDNINENLSDLFFSLIKRRAQGEPYSYITGTKEFMSLEFSVYPGILIPRPDTETLVCHVIDTFKNEKVKILDLCTGSGAIGISLAKYIDKSEVTCVDISDVCIKTAEENAVKNGVKDKITIKKADVLKGIATDSKYDCIVSNPPYIKTSDMKALMRDVKDYEPHLALDGGDDGLIFYRKISETAKKILSPFGMLCFEVGHDQAEDVKNIMIENSFADICFIKDLAGINRVVSGKLSLH